MATPTPSTNTPQKHLPAFSSPAPRSVPAMVNFDSPAALGLLAEGGVGMGISMSGMGMSSLGLTASAMGRADEEERRRRLQSIIDTLKAKPGRVSPKGILDLCQKEGLEVEQEKAALVLMIGTEGMCDIPVRNGEIVADGVNLELAHDRYNYAATASKILGDSLKPLPGMNKVNLTLDRFAHNLEKLMRMDKLSSGGISCYQAIFGVYASLKKLFEHEKKMALALMDTKDRRASQKADREVLCKKSGRPRLNAGDRLGLSLEYWLDRRQLFPPSEQTAATSKGKDKMDVDSSSPGEYPEDSDPENHKIYSLTIECESSPSSMYSPIRISDAWISDAIEKAPDAVDTDINNILLNRPTLDWLEPEPTYLTSAAPAGDHDAMNLDNAPGRLPNIRFIAKFNPPLVVPLSVFVTIQQSLGLEVPNDIRATTFVGLALRPGEADPGMTGVTNESTHELRAEQNVLVVNTDGKEEQHTHSNSLYVPRTEYSRTIESLPFWHPRQLVEILPTLRQYAFTTSLLKHTFGTTSQTPSPPHRETHLDPLTPPLTPEHSTQTPPLQLDISLSYAPPAPRLRFDMPHPLSAAPNLSTLSTSASDPSDLLAALLAETPPHSPLTITLDVHPNAELIVSAQNVVDVSPRSSRDKTKHQAADGDGGAGDVDLSTATQSLDERVKRFARALDVCLDIGVWAEWVRREVVVAREEEKGE